MTEQPSFSRTNRLLFWQGEESGTLVKIVVGGVSEPGKKLDTLNSYCGWNEPTELINLLAEK